MAIVKMHCPYCGGVFETDPYAQAAGCPYCRRVIQIDDDMRDILLGRKRSARPAKRPSAKKPQTTGRRRKTKKQKDMETLLWILGWIFIFPLPLTILLMRGRKTKAKYVIIAAAWIVYIILIILLALFMKNGCLFGAKEEPENGLTVTYKRTDKNTIGEEWTYLYMINGRVVKDGEYILNEGDELTLYAKFTENDDLPDVGEASVVHKVTAQDVKNGFTEKFSLQVKENGGIYKGRTADFEVVFTFTVKKHG